MRTLWKYGMPATGCAIIAAGIMLVTPRRSEGQFASPVKVTNAPAQSVPVTTGGTPFTHQFLQTIPQGSSETADSFTPSNSLGFNIEMFNLLVTSSVASNLPSAEAEIVCNSGGTANARLFFGATKYPQAFGSQDGLIVNTLVKFHCDANSQVNVFINTPVSSDGNFTAFYTITGYLQ